jgi:hypothetical protein
MSVVAKIPCPEKYAPEICEIAKNTVKFFTEHLLFLTHF